MVLDVDQGTKDIGGPFLLVAECLSAYEVPEVDILWLAVFLIDAEFGRLKVGGAVAKRNTVFAVGACPAVEHPAGVRCMRTCPTIRGFAGRPVGDVEADEGFALLKSAKQCIVKIKEIANSRAGLG